MTVIYFLIPLSVVIAGGFLAGFIWAVRSGQYEDTYTPSMRLLTDEHTTKAEGQQSSTTDKTENRK